MHDVEIGFWILIAFLLLYEPIFGYFSFQRFKEKVKIDENERGKYYIHTIVGLWIPAIFILFLLLFTDLTLRDIGLTIPAIHPLILGSTVTYIGLSLALLYVLLILYYSIGYHFSEKIKNQLTIAKEQQSAKVSFSAILPVTKKERKLWNYVSFTAGVTEEIIYRGFLLFAIAYLSPNVSIWLVILLSSLLFGLAHTYQGALGVFRTTLIGVLFSIIYIGLGSIFPLMAFHFLIDYAAKLGDIQSNPT